MKKNIIVVYICLLAGVLVLRNTFPVFKNESFLKNKQTSINYENNFINQTDIPHRRLLDDGSINQGKNPKRVEICLKADNDGVVTSLQKEQGQDSLSEYTNVFGVGLGASIVNRKEPTSSSSYLRKIIFIGVMVILLLILPFIFLCYCCYCCCDKACPLCCKRDPTVSPFTQKEVLCILGAVIVYSLFVIGAGINGIMYADKIEKSYKSVKCSLESSIDNLNLRQAYTTKDGKQTIFMGLDQLKQDLQSVNNHISDYYQKITIFVNTNQASIKDLSDSSDATQKQFENLRDNIPSNFNSHSPNEQIDAGNTDPYAETLTSAQDSIFYSAKNYPNFVNAAKALYTQVAQSSVDAMKEATNKAQEFANSSQDFYTSSIKSAISEIEKNQERITDAINTIDENENNYDSFFKFITILLIVFYSIFICIATTGTISSVLGFKFEMYRMRFCLNALWSLLSIITFIGIAIAIIITIFSFLLMESCHESQKILNDEKYFKSIDGNDPDFVDYVSTCLEQFGGDGNILDKFGITDRIDKITNSQTKLVSASTSYNSDSYSKFEDSLSFFSKQYAVFEEYGIFVTKSSTSTDLTKVEPADTYTLDFQEANTQFNEQKQYLLGSGNSNPYDACITTSAYDQFVFYDTQCPSTMTPALFTTPLSSPSCVSYQKSNTDFKLETVQSRYASCSSTNQGLIFSKFYEKVMKYVKYMNARYSTQVAFDSGNQKPSDLALLIQDSSSKLGPKLSNFQDNIVTVLNQSSQITDLIVGDNGITKKVNCLSFGNEIVNFRDNICDNLTYWLYETFKIFTITVFVSYTLIFLLYKMAMRLLGQSKYQEQQEEKENKYYNNNNPYEEYANLKGETNVLN